MAKYTGPVLKKCRALGISPMELGIDKKSNRQVKVSRKKQSNYALQLKEKQKVKFIYGILEKQFKMYYNKAERMRGVTGENMLVLIERRVRCDYRSKNSKKRNQNHDSYTSHSGFIM